MLSTFYSWSIEHIKRVFEAKSENECLQALDETFSERLDFTFNGSQVRRIELQEIVLAMLQSSGFCLIVDWLHAVEVSRDDSNRVSSCEWHTSRISEQCSDVETVDYFLVRRQDGMLGGYYVIRNVKKLLPGSSIPTLVERHKSVNVQ